MSKLEMTKNWLEKKDGFMEDLKTYYFFLDIT